MKLVGEIGIQRKEYLFDIRYVDILQIERGYERRNRHMWSAARWETYHLMLSQCGSENLGKAGIHNPTDLIRFPWDGNEMPISEEEADELRNEIGQYNTNNSKPSDQ